MIIPNYNILATQFTLLFQISYLHPEKNRNQRYSSQHWTPSIVFVTFFFLIITQNSQKNLVQKSAEIGLQKGVWEKKKFEGQKCRSVEISRKIMETKF